MQIFHGRTESLPSEMRGATFSGEVWADPVMPLTDGVTINNVFFPPNARTHWHTHEQGQILLVVAGKGWICLAGEKARAIRTGDTVWIPAGEVHWHGAASNSYLLHTAISLGKTDWQDEVTSTQFAEATE
ncbi:cupin domain-containing protein [Halomonas daqingensis]|uniref:Cupin domain-containing protein n=1 Tax=Billgrantia desiderata TaxID=52021 RepID=A0ABS9B9S2_9GAMM|nr:cupin domain-containing protein [Halomonas desiderata]MCE8044397.1 cupin domain-containing protein [Halomonas desiderata]MCE8048971.1 cupin domain-containing protein [Halomonas desiderata]